MAISDIDYSRARAILVAAGSRTAASYEKHTGDSGSPDGHEQELLREARDEFRQTDSGQTSLRSGMTQAHYDA